MLLAGLGLAPGCGRALHQTRDGQAPAGDAAADGTGGHPDGAPPPVDGPGSDGVGPLVDGSTPGADGSTSDGVSPVDAGVDRTGDVVVRADGGPVDMNPRPDVMSPPDAGQDRVVDRGVDAGRDGDPSCGTLYDVHNCGTCGHDCFALPNVDTRAVQCIRGSCYAYLCLDGFSQCGYTQTDQGCIFDLRSDTNNCGGCGNTCGLVPGSPGICKNGACIGECPSGYGDCTDAFGCETALDSPTDCGACGRSSCGLSNVIASCTQQVPTCEGVVCQAGYGNCETSKPDCETPYGSTAGTCLPTYKGFVAAPTEQGDLALAVGSDGSRFIGGRFYGSADLDFTKGVDQRTAGNAGTPFVSKVTADGRQAWTRTFVTTGDANVLGVAGSPDGGVIVGGYYTGIIDLDPGTGGDYHTALASAVFIAKLSADGTFVWGRVLSATSDDGVTNLVTVLVAADGSIYVGGVFGGHVDLDPGAGVIQRIGGGGYNSVPFVLKMTGDGTLSWADAWDLSFTPGCQIIPSQFAVAPSGTVWMAGSYVGTCDLDPSSGFDLQSAMTSNGDGLVSALDTAGGYLGSWAFSGRSSYSSCSFVAIAADDQGAIYATGNFSGTVDFDPGPAEATRMAGNGGAFILRLGASGALQWVMPETGLYPSAIAIGPGGSLLAAGYINTPGAAQQYGVGEWRPDQSPGWTIGFAPGDYGLSLSRLVATPTGFLVGGSSSGGTDADPGPGVDQIPGGSVFVAEYAY